MKKRNLLIIAAVAGILMTGCSQGSEAQTETTATVQETETTAEATEELTEETVKEETSEEETTQAAAETTKAEETEAETEAEAAGEGFEDNFAVDSAAAAEFGSQIKAAVAEKDLEKLADLTAFPVYVGIPESSGSVETRDEFIALGAEQIFTQELIDSVAAADENSLSPSMAGFVLSNDSGRPNIVFGVRDGKLAISGINY